MKKYIFTESQLKKIINNQLQEQAGTFNFDQKLAIDNGSIDFLKMKGIGGVDLTDKIKKYQKMIGCEETGHMMDCIDVMFTKHRKDFDLWKNLIYKNKPIIDKVGSWLSKKLFGFKDEPKSIY